MLEQLLKAGISLSTYDTPITKNTALHWAASFGSSPDTVHLFISRGADVNALNSDGATPLHEACYQKNSIIVDLLKQSGADDAIVAQKG